MRHVNQMTVYMLEGSIRNDISRTEMSSEPRELVALHETQGHQRSSSRILGLSIAMHDESTLHNNDVRAPRAANDCTEKTEIMCSD